MVILIEFIIAFVIFFAVLWLGYEVTEKRELPTWLSYKPFKCRKCLTFWTLTFIYLTLGISFNMWWLLGTGLLLAILNSWAQAIDERTNTVRIFEDDEDGTEQLSQIQGLRLTICLESDNCDERENTVSIYEENED